VNTVMNLRAPQRTKNILTSLTTISFSVTTLLHGVHVSWNEMALDRVKLWVFGSVVQNNDNRSGVKLSTLVLRPPMNAL
jgi:hypothetical protein